MLAPRLASPSAISRPTRLPAPVTKAVLPLSSMERDYRRFEGTRKGNKLNKRATAVILWNMKAKLLFCLLATLFIASLPALADNDQPPTKHNALRKLGRGFSNL